MAQGVMASLFAGAPMAAKQGARTYFQFPVYALSFGCNPKERIEHVLDYSLRDFGRKMEKLRTLETLREEAKKLPEAQWPARANWSIKDDIGILYAMLVIRVQHGDIPAMKERADVLDCHICSLERRFGRSPLARIRADLLWRAKSGQMAYRDFSVLCGVYSIIGNKKVPVRITRQRIIQVAMGLKSHAMAQALDLPARKDGAVPLTIDQLRRILDRLERQKWFCRVQAGRRTVYFSNRMTRQAMAAAISARAHASAAYEIERHETNHALMRSLADLRDAKARRKASLRPSYATTDAAGGSAEIRPVIRASEREVPPDSGLRLLPSPEKTLFPDATGQPTTQPALPPDAPQWSPTLIESDLRESSSKEVGGLEVSDRPPPPPDDATQHLNPKALAELKQLERLAAHAVEIGTPEALRDRDRFERRIARIKSSVGIAV